MVSPLKAFSLRRRWPEEPDEVFAFPLRGRCHTGADEVSCLPLEGKGDRVSGG